MQIKIIHMELRIACLNNTRQRFAVGLLFITARNIGASSSFIALKNYVQNGSNPKLTILATRLAYNTVFFNYFSNNKPIQHVFIIRK